MICLIRITVIDLLRDPSLPNYLRTKQTKNNGSEYEEYNEEDEDKVEINDDGDDEEDNEDDDEGNGGDVGEQSWLKDMIDLAMKENEELNNFDRSSC